MALRRDIDFKVPVNTTVLCLNTSDFDEIKGRGEGVKLRFEVTVFFNFLAGI